MISPENIGTAVQSVRGMLSFFLAIGLWRVLDYVERVFGRNTAMWLAVVIGCVAFLLLEEFPRQPPQQ